MNIFVDKIVNHLKRNKIEVYGTSFSDKKWFITGKDFILTVIDRKVLIEFHVTTDPIYSAKIGLILNDLTPKIEFTNTFMYDEDGKYYINEEAITKFEEERYNEIIEEYVKDQMQKMFLMSNVMGNA